MSEKKYSVGIDFGHGETSVSRVPGYNSEPVSRVPLRITSHDEEKKVISAICRHKDGWHFVWSKEDFQRPDIREGFKGVISKLTPEDKEALGEFAKLIFKTILKNDPDLQYDENTGEANFSICIASPSDWRRQDPSTPGEYLRFFRDECGIKPIEMCINESDAAFYTKYDNYSRDDTVFFIYLGSSTIDFTTYHHSECISECCWGNNHVGAHLIEDKIIDIGYRDEENVKTMQRVTLAREKAGLGLADAALSLATRLEKEKYFTNHLSSFYFEMKCMDFAPWDSRRAVAFSVDLSKNDFDNVLADYRVELEQVLVNAAQKLSNFGIKPTLILLSGGASRMDFVRESAKKAFPGVQIYQDTCPEWVVSDGAAKYISIQNKSLEQMLDELSDLDFESIYIDADITATQQATETLMTPVLEDLKGSKNYNANEMVKKFCDFFSGLGSDNEDYVRLFDSAARSILNSKISSAVESAIRNAFNKEIDLSDINVNYEFPIFDWDPDNWKPGGNSYSYVAAVIEVILDKFFYNPDKPRYKDERTIVAEGCKEVFCQRDPFDVRYGAKALEDAADKIKTQTLKIAREAYLKNELFRTSQG